LANEADTEATMEVQTDKPKQDHKKNSGTTFKPVMIDRRTRRARYPHRQDIMYTDGGRAHIIEFPAPRRPDNRVEADSIPSLSDWLRRRAFLVPRRQQYLQPEYQWEHELIHPEPRVYAPRPYLESIAPQALDLFGLPAFPDMPVSAVKALSRDLPSFPVAPQLPSFPATPVIHGKKNSFGVVEYPKFGKGPRANLQKLDFALNRLSILNSKLAEAERRVTVAKAASKRVTEQLASLTRVRARIQKLANQISALEKKLGTDPRIQAEVAKVMRYESSFDDLPVLGSGPGSWQGGVIQFDLQD